MSAQDEVRGRAVPLIVLPDEPGPIALTPSSAVRRRLRAALTPRQVSGIVGVLALLNVVVAILLTSRPIPSWLELHRFASDLDAALMMGALHVGLGCCVVLFAARSLFRKHGVTAQLWVMGGIALLGTLLSLARYWSYPVREEAPRDYAAAPSEVPLHGVLPGGR